MQTGNQRSKQIETKVKHKDQVHLPELENLKPVTQKFNSIT